METDRFGLPFLMAGQGQKELTHNEALVAMDALLHRAVKGVGIDAPAEMPEPGDAWVVGASPSGPWSGRAGAIACFTGGGWRYFEPVDGMSLWDASTGRPIYFVSGAWHFGVKPMSGSPSIPDPAGGGTVDTEARSAIIALLQHLRAVGAIAGDGG
jgi:hypothetical protein